MSTNKTFPFSKDLLSIRLATLRYEEGEVDYLNVLDAERYLFEAELQNAQAQADSFTLA